MADEQDVCRKCGSPLAIRKNKKGGRFVGCSNECNRKQTVPVTPPALPEADSPSIPKEDDRQPQQPAPVTPPEKEVPWYDRKIKLF